MEKSLRNRSSNCGDITKEDSLDMEKQTAANTLVLKPIISMTFTRSDIEINQIKHSGKVGKEFNELPKEEFHVTDFANKHSIQNGSHRLSGLTYSAVLSNKIYKLESADTEILPLDKDLATSIQSSDTKDNLAVDAASDSPESVQKVSNDEEIIVKPEVDDIWNCKTSDDSVGTTALIHFGSEFEDTDPVSLNALLPFLPVSNFEIDDISFKQELKSLQPLKLGDFLRNCHLCKEMRYLYENICKTQKIRSEQEQYLRQQGRYTAGKTETKQHLDKPPQILLLSDFQRKFFNLPPYSENKTSEKPSSSTSDTSEKDLFQYFDAVSTPKKQNVEINRLNNNYRSIRPPSTFLTTYVPANTIPRPIVQVPLWISPPLPCPWTAVRDSSSMQNTFVRMDSRYGVACTRSTYYNNLYANPHLRYNNQF